VIVILRIGNLSNNAMNLARVEQKVMSACTPKLCLLFCMSNLTIGLNPFIYRTEVPIFFVNTVWQEENIE